MGLLNELRAKRSRRIVLLLSGVTLALALLGVYFLYRGEGSNTWSGLRLTGILVLGGIVSALLTATFLAIVIAAVSDQESELSATRVVDPAETAQLHLEGLRNSDSWAHDGHIGRWVRTKALPILAEQSGAMGVNKEVAIHILDPRDSPLCETYAQYRQRLGVERPRLSHIRDTKCELIATCLVASAYDAMHPGLTTHIFFKSAIDFYRIDICDDYAFLTIADPRCNALAFPRYSAVRRHNLYEAMRLSLTQRRQTDEEVTLRSVPGTKKPSKEQVQAFVKDNTLWPDATDADIAEIRRLCRSDWNPFK